MKLITNTCDAIKLKDNGCDIDQSLQHKIFEPFHTTKKVGQGTGLGHSLAFSIIKQHQDQIHVNVKQHHGAEFEVVLPMNYAA